MLHIHNGDSVATSARRANLSGRHLPFREAMIGGPVQGSLPHHDFLEQRARWLADSSDEKLLRVRNGLFEQEHVIDSARNEDEVILWFEHDLFCLVHLIYLLGRLAKCRHLKLVWSPKPLGLADADVPVTDVVPDDVSASTPTPGAPTSAPTTGVPRAADGRHCGTLSASSPRACASTCWLILRPRRGICPCG